MSKIKIKGGNNYKKKDAFLLPGIICMIWGFLLLVVFPVYMHNAYFDILGAKSYYLLVVNGALLVAMLAWGAFHWKTFTGRFAETRLNVLDIAMIVLGVCYILAFLVSDYKEDTIIGSNARYGGVAMYCLFVTTYFLISRFWKFNVATIRWFMFVMIFVSLFTVTDFFRGDIFGLKKYIDPNLYGSFSTTIGNIDTVASFLAIPMAFSGVMFLLTKNDKHKAVTYGISFFIMMLGVIMSRADNGYLALAAFFGFIPLIAFKTKKGFRRYILAAGGFLAIESVMIYLTENMADKIYAPGGFLNIFALLKVPVLIGAIVLIAIGVILCVMAAKKGVNDEALMPGWVRWVYLGFIIVIFAIGIGIYVIANIDITLLPEAFQKEKSILVFDDHFGGGRGYTWKATIDLWKNNLTLPQKLFGAGPETSGIYMTTFKYEEMVETTHLIFDSPHNEFLQMFFNLGIVGCIAYVGSFVTAIVLLLKNKLSEHYNYCVAIAFIILCHMFECVVNIVVPIDCGLLFAFIALGGYFLHEKQE